jgi:hypothetical protein
VTSLYGRDRWLRGELTEIALERAYRRGFYWGVRKALSIQGATPAEIGSLAYLSRLETWKTGARTGRSDEPEPPLTPTAGAAFLRLTRKLAARQQSA